MKQTMVPYKIKLEEVQENVRLIERVFQELKAKAPDGVRYLCLRLNDGNFVHFATVESTDGAHPITCWKLSEPSKAVSRSAAWNCRSPVMPPSSATTAWLARELRVR
jgi:hypothetical protein